jgi:drug/metabolite transporter (DMT)-like permease
MERERMSYGLLSALSWGISTLLAAVAARRIGALRTVVIGEVAGLAGYWTLFLLGHFSLRGVGGSAWLLVLAGVIAVAGYLALYRGLESGHVGLVSAISACYGGVIALLSVVLLHEHLTVDAVVGIVATVVGVMLAVTQRDTTPAPGTPAPGTPVRGTPAPGTPAPGTPAPDTPAPGTLPPGTVTPGTLTHGIPSPDSSLPGPTVRNPPAPSPSVPGLPVLGPPALDAPDITTAIAATAGAPARGAKAPAVGVTFGLAAALCYGIGGFMIGRYTRSLGWLVPVVVARGGAMILLLGLLATPLRGPTGARLGPGLAWAFAAGLTDAAGLVFFTRGDQVGLVAVTASVSSAYPVIPLVGGLLVFRERLMRQQVGGALIILAGLILLGLGS